MMKLPPPWTTYAAVLVLLFPLNEIAVAATQYIITNDDLVPAVVSGLTLYSVKPDGSLTLEQFIDTFGNGIAGGFFGANRLRVLSSGNQQCVFASQSLSGQIAGFDLTTMTEGAFARGSPDDQGSSNGIGLTMNSQYVYASYTDSNTIGTFALQEGCGLSFISDVSVAGLDEGTINGMAARGNILVATYTDGTIESFDISGGTPISHGDKQFSTGTVRSHGASFPNSLDITSDGHFAIFGDTSTSLVVEVSDISSGTLTQTIVHTSAASISSSNIMLSADETILYVVNTQGDSVSAFFFNKATGRLSGGCTSGRIRGHSLNWSYLGGMTLANPTGNGGGVYVAEFGVPSAIALIKLTVTGRTCSLKEKWGSPFPDPNSEGLLSIGAFPPRAF
jgi:hypothetical protein